jgi:hypothetical protein
MIKANSPVTTGAVWTSNIGNPASAKPALTRARSAMAADRG